MSEHLSAADNLGPHLLGRNPSPPDPRDKNYGMAEELSLDMTLREVQERTSFLSSWFGLLRFWRWIKANRPPVVTTDSKIWELRQQLDQASTPHCVGFGWAGWHNSKPVDAPLWSNTDGHELYYEIKLIDGEPREENGSSVRSGAKAMRNRGRIDTYVWASTTAEITAWIQQRGPVVAGTDWTGSMFRPDRDGFIRPEGSVEGGHCYLLLGYDASRGAYLIENSWGSWGQDGRAWIRVDDFGQLLNGNGEACAGVELA